MSHDVVAANLSKNFGHMMDDDFVGHDSVRDVCYDACKHTAPYVQLYGQANFNELAGAQFPDEMQSRVDSSQRSYSERLEDGFDMMSGNWDDMTRGDCDDNR